MGRGEVGPWLMALMLCLIHMDTAITQGHPLETADMVVDTLLGLSLLIIVLEESKAKARRLEVLNRITDAIAKAQECSPMVMAVMLELKDLLGASAVWFRLLEGDVLRLQQAVGVSEKFAEEHRDSDTRFGHGASLIRAGSAILLDRANSLPMVRETLVRDDLNHILLIPVRGKTAVIGTLSLGMRKSRVYQPGEVRFLNAAAKQLGIATENVQLVQRISVSQKRWANTFDAMPELILVHDQEFRIRQVNRALQVRLGWEHEPEKLVGQLCGEVLRKPGANWKNCPYCESHQADVEAPDPVIDDDAASIGAAHHGGLVLDAIVGATTLILAALVALVLLRALGRQRALLRVHLASLGERNRELNAFAARTAHDSKGPLSPLKGYADLLSLRDEPEVREIARRMQRASERMTGIIEDLLELSVHGKPVPGQVTVTPVVLELLDELRGDLRDAEVKLESRRWHDRVLREHPRPGAAQRRDQCREVPLARPAPAAADRSARRRFDRRLAAHVGGQGPQVGGRHPAGHGGRHQRGGTDLLGALGQGARRGQHRGRA